MGESRSWHERVKDAALATIYVAFTIVGVWMAATTSDGRDRLIGIACAIFFGAGGVAYFGRDLLASGLRARPSPALRVGGAAVELDRLELFASPKRLLFFGAGAAFFGAGAVVGFLLGPGIEGILVGGLCGAFSIAFIIVIGVVVRAGALVVFEPTELRYRWPFRARIRVPYDELLGGVVVPSAAGAVCALVLADPDGFLDAATPPARRHYLKMMRTYGSAIVLPIFVGPNAEQLLELVEQYACWTDGSSYRAPLPTARGVLEA